MKRKKVTTATKPLDKVIQIDEAQVRGHLDEMVRSTVEETLNALLDAEADRLCRAQRYERSPERQDTRAGSYRRRWIIERTNAWLQWLRRIVVRQEYRTDIFTGIVHLVCARVTLRRVSG